ncbi:MAG: replication initiation negative regulator SeqA [Colwellia sp.]
MKNIEIDEALYQHIASNTQFIGESASAILRRLLRFDLSTDVETVPVKKTSVVIEENNLSALDDSLLDATSLHSDLDDMNEDETITAVNVLTASNESVFNFINKEELAMQRGAVGRFLLILAALYRAHPRQFGVVTEISGRDRLYFAHSENKLAESGSSTKPRQIPESPFWVITNSNTTRKKMMLTKASISLGYSESDVEKIRELL